MDEHLGYEKHDVSGRGSGNSRNGTRTKTVMTEIGPVEIDVPEISAWVPTLEAFAEGGSVRAASVILHRHPSTAHARLDSLSTALGFDVRAPQGRLRTAVAVTLLRLKTAAF